MTPQEDAKRITERCAIYTWSNGVCDYLLAKQFASIVASEIQNTKAVYVNDVDYEHWEQVITEIWKL